MSEVKIIGVTQPVHISDMTPNDLIAYTARVSNPSNQNNKATASKLLRYLIRENHWSPFEMVSVTMEIKTTRDISRQILRHRSFSFQEFSQRYADPTTDLQQPFVAREARLQDYDNRQASVSLDGENSNHIMIQNKWIGVQDKVVEEAQKAYEWAIDNGIAKEQARVVLPEGNMSTTLYMAGTLRSWIHYCELRRGNGTQLEHMQVADQCWDTISELFPDVALALAPEDNS